MWAIVCLGVPEQRALTRDDRNTSLRWLLAWCVRAGKAWCFHSDAFQLLRYSWNAIVGKPGSFLWSFARCAYERARDRDKDCVRWR
jgi:hypothetical protein